VRLTIHISANFKSVQLDNCLAWCHFVLWN
jgi:hypothetical protein